MSAPRENGLASNASAPSSRPRRSTRRPEIPGDRQNFQDTKAFPERGDVRGAADARRRHVGDHEGHVGALVGAARHGLESGAAQPFAEQHPERRIGLAERHAAWRRFGRGSGNGLDESRHGEKRRNLVLVDLVTS
jgi:hypothetical protein